MAINQQQKEQLENSNKFPEKIHFDGKEYAILDRNSTTGFVDLQGRIGKTGFVLKVENEFEVKYALKINDASYYNKDKAVQEVRLSSKLQSHDIFVIPTSYDFIPIDEIQPIFQGECCCFISSHPLKTTQPFDL